MLKTDTNKINIENIFDFLSADKIISVYIPETPLLKRDDFGEYTLSQLSDDFKNNKRGVIYDDEEVIFEQGFNFKIKYIHHLLPLRDSDIKSHIIRLFPEFKDIEFSFITNKKYYINSNLCLDFIQIEFHDDSRLFVELVTTKDAKDYSYKINCKLIIDGVVLTGEK